MLECGENWIDGVRVVATRKRVKRMALRVAEDGGVALSLPPGMPPAAAEAFLAAHWAWVLRTRGRMLANPRPAERPATLDELLRLRELLGGLHAAWAERLGEVGVTWRLSRMRSRWGVCNWAKRRVGYSTMLAFRPRDEVEYVVVHELTHLQVHDHGPRFRRLMDGRLPSWRALRARLNRPPSAS